MGRAPELHNLALEDRLMAALRETDGGLTAGEAADAIGTIPCQCLHPASVTLMGRHRDQLRYPGGCAGTGWRQAIDADVRARLARLERQGFVGRSTVAGRVLYWGRVNSIDQFAEDPFWIELGEDVARMERRRYEPWEERFWGLWEGEAWPVGVPYAEPHALRLLGLRTWP